MYYITLLFHYKKVIVSDDRLGNFLTSSLKYSIFLSLILRFVPVPLIIFSGDSEGCIIINYYYYFFPGKSV